ncbi:hypothetical protein BKA70DRAFT_1277802 [Coprinopsis sp. MPI-PUGE-AT-0042]|nr:hypothetical protein BKA70DRAFT_1277802 [Coprinopsis sp. MPI-PUGE-AT-0042]
MPLSNTICDNTITYHGTYKSLVELIQDLVGALALLRSARAGSGLGGDRTVDGGDTVLADLLPVLDLGTSGSRCGGDGRGSGCCACCGSGRNCRSSRGRALRVLLLLSSLPLLLCPELLAQSRFRLHLADPLLQGVPGRFNAGGRSSCNDCGGFRRRACRRASWRLSDAGAQGGGSTLHEDLLVVPVTLLKVLEIAGLEVFKVTGIELEVVVVTGIKVKLDEVTSIDLEVVKVASHDILSEFDRGGEGSNTESQNGDGNSRGSVDHGELKSVKVLVDVGGRFD